MNCFFHELGLVDDKGDVHLETLHQSMPGSFVDLILKPAQHCVHPEGDTLCHKAWWFHQCWKKADPVVKLFLFFSIIAALLSVIKILKFCCCSFLYDISFTMNAKFLHARPRLIFIREKLQLCFSFVFLYTSLEGEPICQAEKWSKVNAQVAA
uniref:Uncharacterized protein n=1 Tax=Glossina morsitans morsitans TaxID=37546 RepID=A0A1B0GG02_GLOMM